MQLRVIIRIGLALAVLTCFAGWLVLSNDSPINRASAIKATCEWARLNRFPDSAKNIKVETTGSIFTREFRITFSATPESIQSWLRESPGTRTAIAKSEDSGRMIYSITPGGGAQFAEVSISNDKRTVRIRAYWS